VQGVIAGCHADACIPRGLDARDDHAAGSTLADRIDEDAFELGVGDDEGPPLERLN
jgi:hypothetical protein